MEEEHIPPKIFISYSWHPDENKENVISIAERLCYDGIDVILDVWDLKEGRDKYQFMEQMVNNPDVKKVLLMCNSDYVKKANSKKGGVGTESLIISDEIYSNTKQEKFIPIILEKDDKGQPIVPTFVKTRIYIDLSDIDYFEDEYEKLLRNLLDKPIYNKPAIGKPPIYITQENSFVSRTAKKIGPLKNALIKQYHYANQLIVEYLDCYIDNLMDLKIKEIKTTQEVDDVIYGKIEESKPTKDEFVNVLNLILRYSNFDGKVLHRFYQKLLEFLVNTEQETRKFPSNTSGRSYADHFIFIVYELFVYVTAMLLKMEMYDKLGYIIHNKYVIHQTDNNKFLDLSYLSFCNSNNTIDKIRLNRLKKEQINISGTLINQRVNTIISFDELQTADLLLYYISVINAPSPQNSRLWNPYTGIYMRKNFILLEKCISKRHFNQIKRLLNVKDLDEFKKRLEFADENGIDFNMLNRRAYKVPFLFHLLNISKVGTVE